MKFRIILKVLAYLLGAIALSMMIPLLWAVAAKEGEMIRAFFLPFSLALVLSLAVILMSRNTDISFYASDGFFIVILGWVLTCLAGAFPYYLSGYAPGFTDAVFESVSGFTTTGASVIANIENLPSSLLLWRAMTNWLGGAGIIILTVAILPLLGGSGFQILKTEAQGAEKDRITPRITESARIILLLYAALTAFLALLLILGGLDYFTAITRAFSTVSTGGFSAHNGGVMSNSGPLVSWILAAFMIFAGMNYTLIYRFVRGRYGDLINNSEAKAYLGILLAAAALVAVSLMTGGGDSGFIRPESPGGAVRLAFFQVSSVMSTTGFSIANHNSWPPLAKACLFFLMFIGGCSGSMAGGIKVLRVIIMKKQAGNEMKRLLNPRGVFSIRLNKKQGRKDVVYSVAAFVFMYFFTVFLASILISSAGLDILSSVSGALLTLGNIGLGFGEFPAAFCGLPGYVKWGLSIVMIMGRLELWPIIIFISRDYWRR